MSGEAAKERVTIAYTRVPSKSKSLASYTAKNLIPIRGRKRARYGTELQYRYVQLGQSHCIFCMGSVLQLESTCNPSVGSRP